MSDPALAAMLCALGLALIALVASVWTDIEFNRLLAEFSRQREVIRGILDGCTLLAKGQRLMGIDVKGNAACVDAFGKRIADLEEDRDATDAIAQGHALHLEELQQQVNTVDVDSRNTMSRVGALEARQLEAIFAARTADGTFQRVRKTRATKRGSR